MKFQNKKKEVGVNVNWVHNSLLNLNFTMYRYNLQMYRYNHLKLNRIYPFIDLLIKKKTVRSYCFFLSIGTPD